MVKILKYIVFLITLGVIFFCKPANFGEVKEVNIANDTIRIANDELEYEIIIIDPQFNGWYKAYARPRGYYNQSYLEARNRIWVLEYNLRAMNPISFDPNLYPISIDYQNNIDYGYEVNYMLFNYLVYFQMTQHQKLGGFVARP